MYKVPAKENKVCKLLRPLYGLKQSGREWHQKLQTCLNAVKSKMSEKFKMKDLDQVAEILGMSNAKELQETYAFLKKHTSKELSKNLACHVPIRSQHQ